MTPFRMRHRTALRAAAEPSATISAGVVEKTIGVPSEVEQKIS